MLFYLHRCRVCVCMFMLHNDRIKSITFAKEYGRYLNIYFMNVSYSPNQWHLFLSFFFFGTALKKRSDVTYESNIYSHDKISIHAAVNHDRFFPSFLGQLLVYQWHFVSWFTFRHQKRSNRNILFLKMYLCFFSGPEVGEYFVHEMHSISDKYMCLKCAHSQMLPLI